MQKIYEASTINKFEKCHHMRLFHGTVFRLNIFAAILHREIHHLLSGTTRTTIDKLDKRMLTALSILLYVAICIILRFGEGHFDESIVVVLV